MAVYVAYAPVRRARLARDLLHDRDGALTHERDGHGVGTDALARDAAGGVGGATQARRAAGRRLSYRSVWPSPPLRITNGGPSSRESSTRTAE